MPVTISEDITGVASINGGQLGGRNYIINGAMLISQRGTSFAAVAHGEYTLDRWTANDTGAGVFTISQDTDVPNETYENSLKVDCTTADASIAAGDIYAIQQYIEGLNSIPFAMGTSGAVTVTLSFWVKSTKTGTFCVALKNADASRGYVSQYTVSDTNTWERKTITIPLDQTGTWLRTNGKGLAVMFTLACGSTRQASSADTWEAGNVSATSSQVNALDSTANNFLITGVQLEEGSTATDFEHRTFGDELALCQRYYEVLGRDPTTYTFSYPNMPAKVAFTNNYLQGHAYHTVKRAAPTVVLFSRNDTSGKVSLVTNGADEGNNWAINSGGTVGFHLAVRDGGTHTVGIGMEYGFTADAEV